MHDANEIVVLSGRTGEARLAIVHAPADPAALGVVIVVGGPQYRAGSQRQFVRLARSLAAAGYAVLRFDVRGMGDSEGDPRSFEQLDADVAGAIDLLVARVPRVQQVVLWGLCDGASAALMYLDVSADARVSGVCALNPWVRTMVGLERAQLKHYYALRVLEADFWRKLLRLRVARGALVEFFGKLWRVRALRAADPASFQDRMARGLERLDGRLLLLLSGNDLTAQEFADFTAVQPVWRRLLEHPRIERHKIHGATHTCAEPESRQAVERLTLDWLRRHTPGGPAHA